MADRELVDLIRRNKSNIGDTISQWKREHPNQQMGLSSTSFQNEDLSGVDLSYAYLRNANFAGADLKEANLTGCRLNEKTNLCRGQLKTVVWLPDEGKTVRETLAVALPKRFRNMLPNENIHNKLDDVTAAIEENNRRYHEQQNPKKKVDETLDIQADDAVVKYEKLKVDNHPSTTVQAFDWTLSQEQNLQR